MRRPVTPYEAANMARDLAGTKSRDTDLGDVLRDLLALHRIMQRPDLHDEGEAYMAADDLAKSVAEILHRLEERAMA